MTDVIKRNGRIEPFREEKIRKTLESATRHAGYDPQDQRDLIDKTIQDVKQQIGNVDQVEAGEIRNIVLNDLEQEEQSTGDTDIAAAWRNYELEHGIIYEEKVSKKPHKLESFKRR